VRTSFSGNAELGVTQRQNPAKRQQGNAVNVATGNQPTGSKRRGGNGKGQKRV